MKKILLFFAFIICTSNTFCQSTFQNFQSAGFRVKCSCKLEYDAESTNLAKRQAPGSGIIGSYVGFSNIEDINKALIANVNVYDHSPAYRGINPAQITFLEKKYLEDYANNLGKSGITYDFVYYKGSNAIKYSFMQEGIYSDVIVFLSNQKHYQILVMSNNATNRNRVFKEMIDSFETY